MRFPGIGFLALATMLSVAVLAMAPASAAGSRAFCGTWLSVCNKTCSGGPGTCGGVCAARHSAWLSSGCFNFNVPGPRCEGNATDQTATTRARDTMRKGQAIGCGPRFGGRPCD